MFQLCFNFNSSSHRNTVDKNIYTPPLKLKTKLTHVRSFPPIMWYCSQQNSSEKQIEQKCISTHYMYHVTLQMTSSTSGENVAPPWCCPEYKPPEMIKGLNRCLSESLESVATINASQIRVGRLYRRPEDLSHYYCLVSKQIFKSRNIMWKNYILASEDRI